MKSEQKISRQRRKWLQAQLKAQLGPSRRSLTIGGLLNWGQFVMRLVSFVIIAWSLAQLYQGATLPLGWVVAGLLALTAGGALLGRWAEGYQGQASRYARNQLKQRFFQVFRDHEGELTQQSVTEITTVASQGIDSLDTFYNQYLTTTLRVRLNCLTIWLLLLWLFPLGSLVLVACVPLIPISIILMQKRSQAIMQRYWGSYMDVGNRFMDDLKGMNTLYTYDAATRYEQSFVAQAEDFRRATMELLKFQLQSVGYMDGVMYIGITLAGCLAASSLAQGHISLMTFVLFLLIAAEFFGPIRELGYCMHLLMMNTKMADRIFTFFEAAEATQSDSAPAAAVTTTPELATLDAVTLDGVSLAYEAGQPLFQPINAVFKRQAITAIAGESGVGKSSLAKALMGQLAVEAGQIRFGDTNLSQLDHAFLKEQVLYVSPHSYVFNGTIWDNLALATDWSMEAVRRWLEVHELLPFVADLPEGLATSVGEDGANLSPGQRQQLLVVRALLSPRAVYLFDEMTSSVDTQTEAQIFKAVQLAKEQAIVIWISHKMKQVALADSVLFLDQEEAQQGTPEALYAHHAGYRQFVDTQAELEAILHDVV